MLVKAELMDETAVLRSLARITHEIIEKNRGADNLCLLGIRRRGVPIAERIADNIRKFEGVSVPVGDIDITLYRDDLSEMTDLPVAADSHIPCALKGKTVILTDDVIYTGRTVRAAIEAVFSAGRPEAIRLAVLIDRGHRELPFRPDFVGKNIPTSQSELVKVELPPYDEATRVLLCER